MAEPGFVEALLIPTEKKYAIPDNDFSLPVSATEVYLDSMLKSVLKDYGVETGNVVFEFLIMGELLRSSLQEQLDTKKIPMETKLKIHYFVKSLAPCPEMSMYLDDWVSSVRANKDWVLAGCYDGTVHLWSIQKGVHKLTIPGHTNSVKSVAWIESDDPVSSFVSTSFDQTAVLWKWNQITNSVDCVNVCKGHTLSVDCVDVCRAQKLIVTGSYDKTVKLWSADIQDDGPDEFAVYVDRDDHKRQKIDSGKSKTKVPIRTLCGHVEGVTGVQWTDINEVLTCSVDHTLRAWDVEIGVQKIELNGPVSFMGISYSSHARAVVAACTDRYIRLYDPRSSEGSVVKSVFSSHYQWVTSVKWSMDNEFQFVSGAYDMKVKLWDTRCTKTCLYDMLGHEDKVLCVDYFSNNIFSGGADNNLKVSTIPQHKLEAAHGPRDEEILRLQSMSYKSAEEEERLKTLRLERAFQHRAKKLHCEDGDTLSKQNSIPCSQSQSLSITPGSSSADFSSAPSGSTWVTEFPARTTNGSPTKMMSYQGSSSASIGSLQMASQGSTTTDIIIGQPHCSISQPSTPLMLPHSSSATTSTNPFVSSAPDQMTGTSMYAAAGVPCSSSAVVALQSRIDKGRQEPSEMDCS